MSKNIAAGLSAIGAMLGTKVAKTVKKKKAKNVNKTKKSGIDLRKRESLVMAPVSGVYSRISRKTKNVFDVPFTATPLQVATNNTGFPVLTSVGTLATAATQSNVTVQISQNNTASTTLYPLAFGKALRNLASTFHSYRIKPGSARVYYRGACPTSTAGIICLSLSCPDLPTSTLSPVFNDVASSECSIQAAPWTPSIEFDKKAFTSILDYEVDEGWRDTILTGTTSEAEVRQTSLFNAILSATGTPANTVLGIVVLEGVMQFRHLEDSADYDAIKLRNKFFDAYEASRPETVNPPSTTSNLSSSSSSSSSSHPEEKEYYVKLMK
jgi:hypothetical protein